MKRFVLICGKNHKFEAWFRSEEDCRRLIVAGHVECPVCPLGVAQSSAAAPEIGAASKAFNRSRARGPRRPTAH